MTLRKLFVKKFCYVKIIDIFKVLYRMRYDHRFVTKSLGTISIFKLSPAVKETIIKYTKKFFIFVFTNSIILIYASMFFQNFEEVFL